MSWISKLINWATTSTPNIYGRWENGVYKYNTSYREPTATEIAELRQKIQKFGNHLNVEEFKQCINSFTQTIVSTYDMGEFIDINKMADSAYDNFLARLYQTAKYINQNPSNTRFQADVYLKFDTVHVVEYYPILMNLIIYGEECTIAKRGGNQYYADRKQLNQTIHGAIYDYALKIIPEVKEMHKEFKEYNFKNTTVTEPKHIERELEEIFDKNKYSSVNNEVDFSVNTELYPDEFKITNITKLEDDELDDEYIEDSDNYNNFNEEDVLIH
jgi:hypothetical protein